MKIGVYPFHGKLTASQRDRVVFGTSVDRKVVFTTNVAETGLTIPDVRFVIDTCLERRVCWNPESSLSEMVTQHASLSSLKQRSGRAGRVASGICIRLCSEETLSKLEANEAPEIDSSSLLTAVLRLHAFSPLELPSAIAPEMMESARNMLCNFGALTKDKFKVTDLGYKLLSLGLNLQLGRFLFACNTARCLERGAKLAALLAVEAHTRLLPSRHRARSPLLHFQHPSGDHLSLLNLFEYYLQHSEKAQGGGWCISHHVDPSLMADAENALDYILDNLLRLDCSLDCPNTTPEDADRNLLCALCAAFFTQLGVVRRTGVPRDGYVWLVDEEKRTQLVKSIDNFNTAHGPSPLYNPTPATPTSPSQAVPTTTPVPTTSPPLDGEVLLKLGDSTLWHPQDSPTEAQAKLVVFYSVMQTDRSQGVPTIQCVSYVTPDDVQKGVPAWCNSVKFHSMLEASIRDEKFYDLNESSRQLFLAEKGAWLHRLRRRFPSVAVSVEGTKLHVAAPRSVMRYVERRVAKQLNLELEVLKVPIPSGVNIGKLIGEKGKNIKQLNQDLQDILKQALGTPSAIDAVSVERPRDSPDIHLKVSGRAKTFMGLFLGRVQTALFAANQNPPSTLQITPSGTHSRAVVANPRLAILTTMQPPRVHTRDDAILYLAHTAIWQAKCSVYGGFLRDWVVRGESANDVDVELKIGLSEAISIFKKAAAALGGVIAFKGENPDKGAAHSLIFGGNWKDIEVDLVNPANVPFSPPGVDCDTGNLALTAGGVLTKKVPAAGGDILPLHKCIQHAQQKQFVFFYNTNPSHPNAARVKQRLVKHLGRGWTCLSPVQFPDVVQQYGNLIKVDDKYNRRWWENVI